MSWKLDKAHTALEFSVRHMMVSTVRGHFTEFDGEASLDFTDLTRSRVEGEVKVASITTREEQRDTHLRSSDFFDVEKYPNISYHTTKITHIDSNAYKVCGNLTIKGVTKELILEAELTGVATSPYGKKSAGIEARGTLSRADFNLTWNVALETGGFLVGDEVKISIDAEFSEEADNLDDEEEIAA